MTYHPDETRTSLPSKRGRIGQTLVAVLLAGFATTAFFYRESLLSQISQVVTPQSEEMIPVQTLERTAFGLEVPANGEVTGLQTAPVPTPPTRSGSLKVAWLVPEGSLVNAGDSVVRFDSTDARLNLEKQENTLEANQERVKITTGKQTLDEKVLTIDQSDAQKEYQHAVTVMPQDETIFSKWDIIEAKINASFAKERIGFLNNKGRVQKRIARADQQILAIEKNKARAEITIAQQTLDSLELKAPKAGLVLYRRDRMRDPQIGDESWPGQIILEIVDLQALQARVYVLERDAGSLGVDQTVKIRLDAIPEKEFTGTIRSMASLAQPLERNSPLKYFACEVTVQDVREDLRRIRPGMSLKARVILERYDSCFVVPASAITAKGTETLVHVKQGDRFVARSVKLGIGSHGQSTILAGVQEKEVIAMRDPFETRKLHLPDFSKAAAAAAQGGPGPGGRSIMIRN